jgi:hypothetical protein
VWVRLPKGNKVKDFKIMFMSKNGGAVEVGVSSFGHEIDLTLGVLINGSPYFPDHHYSILARISSKWGHSKMLFKSALRGLLS